MDLAARAADLALSGLTKSYGTSLAVDDVTFRIAAGEVVALLGPSGCGKTTTLRMIAGLVDPTAGDVYIGGRAMKGVPIHRRNIGMLFQNYALFPHMTVAENVAFGLEMRGLRRREAKARVQEALELVQLGAFGARLPSALSGGQQQRVALARALVIEPSVLLLDEPLGALDKGLRESMQVELRLLQRRLGITTVIVTHDQEEALTLADRIVVMRAGRLEQMGTPQEIYDRPASRFVAGFIGASNFLRGRAAGGVVTLADGARLTVAGARDGDATVAVRPEVVAVELAGPGDLPPNCVAAVVDQMIYRGALTQVHLRLATGETLLAARQNRGAREGVGAGDAVVARWTEADNHIVSEDASTSMSEDASTSMSEAVP